MFKLMFVNKNIISNKYVSIWSKVKGRFGFFIRLALI